MFHTMKKALLFSAALAAMALVSCNREPAAPVTEAPGSPVEVTVEIRGASATRVTGLVNQEGRNDAASEAKVNSLQIFVFKDNDREAYRKVTDALSALVPATSGERAVWAVVNAPDLDAVMTLDGLKAAVTALSENAADSFVMTGNVTQDLVDGGQVPITVKRIVARVSINKISSDFKDYRVDWSARIHGLYLINVAGDNNYDVSGAPVNWVNKLGHFDETYDPILADALSAVVVKNSVYNDDGTIATDNSYRQEHVFYPYPNAIGTDVDGYEANYSDEWSPRATILVIEATLYYGNGDPVEIDPVSHPGQTLGYYPIVLPHLERNKTYVIDEVCITRLPGTEPYKPIETGETQVTITVSEWEVGLNLGTIRI